MVFRRTNTAVARIESVSRSPLYADFSETLNGLNTIRAYRNQSNCIKKLETGLNKNTIAVMIVQLVGNWLGLRLDIMGGAIIFFIAALAVISDSYFSNDFIPAGYLALGLTYSFSMTIYLKFTVRMVATLEAQMNNVERVKFYSESIDNEQSVIPPSDPDIYDEEGGWKQLGSPVNHHPFSKPLLGDDKNASDSLRPYTPPVLPSNWPVQGAVEGINLEMRYRDGPLVLKGISFKVAPGEKVGIAGRTGSGKSSLMNALFRMQELSGGKITIDGYDISTVPLTTLRSRVGIIPQDPVMFSSTVRFNLDPFDKCTDDEIW